MLNLREFAAQLAAGLSRKRPDRELLAVARSIAQAGLAAESGRKWNTLMAELQQLLPNAVAGRA